MSLNHGGDWAGFEAEFGRPPLDFSANVSPLDVPSAVRPGQWRSSRQAARYPDPLCRRLTEALALHEKVEQTILCGNSSGSDLPGWCWRKSPVQPLLLRPPFSDRRQALETVDWVKDTCSPKKTALPSRPRFWRKSLRSWICCFCVSPITPRSAHRAGVAGHRQHAQLWYSGAAERTPAGQGPDHQPGAMWTFCAPALPWRNLPRLPAVGVDSPIPGWTSTMRTVWPPDERPRGSRRWMWR